MNTRRLGVPVLLGIFALAACAGQEGNSLTVADMAITWSNDLNSTVSSVEASMWAAGDMGNGTAALYTADSADSGSLTHLRFFLPSSLTAVDASCLAKNSLGNVIGYGVVLGQSLTLGQQNSISCLIIANDEPDTPVLMPISLQDSHHFESVLVSPEPAACDADFSYDFDVSVSDPQSDDFNFYATGDVPKATMPGGSEAALSGAVLSATGETSTTAGSAYTLSMHYDDGVNPPSGDLTTNIWAIDPDTGHGEVIRTSTLCGSDGTHSVDVQSVAYFYTDSSTYTFDVVISADGTDLSYACDTDLDGTADVSGTVTDEDLLGVRQSGDLFTLIISSGTSVTQQVVDCTP